jgi:hypothetical protein
MMRYMTSGGIDQLVSMVRLPDMTYRSRCTEKLVLVAESEGIVVARVLSQ